MLAPRTQSEMESFLHKEGNLTVELKSGYEIFIHYCPGINQNEWLVFFPTAHPDSTTDQEWVFSPAIAVNRINNYCEMTRDPVAKFYTTERPTDLEESDA